MVHVLFYSFYGILYVIILLLAIVVQCAVCLLYFTVITAVDCTYTDAVCVDFIRRDDM